MSSSARGWAGMRMPTESRPAVTRSESGAPGFFGSTRVKKAVAVERGLPKSMTTLLVSQPNFESHVTPSGHPERADRIRAVEEALSRERFAGLRRKEAVSGDLGLAELVHGPDYLRRLR